MRGLAVVSRSSYCNTHKATLQMIDGLPAISGVSHNLVWRLISSVDWEYQRTIWNSLALVRKFLRGPRQRLDWGGDLASQQSEWLLWHEVIRSRSRCKDILVLQELTLSEGKRVWWEACQEETPDNSYHWDTLNQHLHLSLSLGDSGDYCQDEVSRSVPVIKNKAVSVGIISICRARPGRDKRE